jgi:hypothetical protein
MSIGVCVNGPTALVAVALACNEAPDTGAAWAALEALVVALDGPAKGLHALALGEADGTGIRRAAWLVEFLESYALEYGS